MKKCGSFFFDKMSKFNKLLTRLTKKEKIQFTNIRNERGVIISNSMVTKWIIKEYCKQFYAHRFDNLYEMDQTTKTHIRKNRNLMRPKSIKEFESITNKLPKKKEVPCSDSFTGNSHKHLRKK